MMATCDAKDSSRRRSDNSKHWAKANQVLGVTWGEEDSINQRRRELVDDCQEDQDGVLGLHGGLLYK